MKKILSFFLISATLLTLTACEKKDPNTGALIPQGQMLQLQIWTSQNENFLNSLGAEFLSAAQTAGLTIKVVKFDSDTTLQNMLIDQMAEGKGPDVVFTNGDWIAQNQDKFVLLQNDPTLPNEKFRSMFVMSASDLLLSQDGILGVPMGVETLALFFNEEHLVDRLEARNQPGNTWAEFREDTEKLNQADNSFERFLVSGSAIGRVDNLNYGTEILENIMIQSDVEFFSPDQTAATFAKNTGISASGQRENFAETAMKFYTSFADARYKNFSWSQFLSSPDSEYKDLETFVKGKTSMVFGKPNDIEKVKTLISQLKQTNREVISENNFRVALFPQFSDPTRTNTRKLVAKLSVLSVPKSSKNQTIAWKFLKFATKENNMRSFFQKTKMPTPLLSLIPEQESEPLTGIFVRQAKFARANVLPKGISPDLFHAEMSNSISKINEGKVAIKTALDNLENLFTNNLREYLRLQNQINPPTKKNN